MPNQIIFPKSEVSIKVAVIARNSNGETDIYVTQVHCSQDEFKNGKHFDLAKSEAEAKGYEPAMTLDERDPGWSALVASRAEDRKSVLVAGTRPGDGGLAIDLPVSMDMAAAADLVDQAILNANRATSQGLDGDYFDAFKAELDKVGITVSPEREKLRNKWEWDSDCQDVLGDLISGKLGETSEDIGGGDVPAA